MTILMSKSIEHRVFHIHSRNLEKQFSQSITEGSSLKLFIAEMFSNVKYCYFS